MYCQFNVIMDKIHSLRLKLKKPLLVTANGFLMCEFDIVLRYGMRTGPYIKY